MVRFIFDLRAAGVSLRKIADQLSIYKRMGRIETKARQKTRRNSCYTCKKHVAILVVSAMNIVVAQTPFA